jgi:hypothetical protein
MVAFCTVRVESAGLSVYVLIVARQRLGKNFPAAAKNLWRRRFLCFPRRIKGKYEISSSQNLLLFLYFVCSDVGSLLYYVKYRQISVRNLVSKLQTCS